VWFLVEYNLYFKESVTLSYIFKKHYVVLHRIIFNFVLKTAYCGKDFTVTTNIQEKNVL